MSRPPLPARRVLIVARVRLYRDGLANLIHQDERMDVVGTAGDRDEALDRIGTLAPEVVIVDTALPGSLAMIRAILGHRRDVRVVAIGVPEREAEVIACAEAGVLGYVTLDASATELVDVVERAASGEVLCSPQITSSLFRRIAVLAAANRPEPSLSRLTSREHEIADLLEEGLSNKQIARRLQIEIPTVKNHVHHILEKLNVARRTDAAARLRADSREGLQN